MIKNNKLLFLFLFNFIIGQFMMLFSLYYLNTNKIFIFEEGVYSSWNDSFIYYLVFFLLNVFIIILFSTLINKKEVICNSIKMKKNTFLFLLFFVIFVLSLLIINILISGTPALFIEGYISRFDYLQETKLWFVLKIFGAPAAIIPIVLGFLLLQNKKYEFIKANYIIYFLSILYFVYVILIGQKFGAIQLGIFFLVLPIFAHKILQGQVILSMKILFYFFVLLLSLVFLLYYHYSHLPIAEEFGGPLRFIAYRIFALQGHTFWGTIDNLDNINASFSFWWDGMHNLMRVIGIDNIESAIERGVNFTGGYPVILIAIFPIVIAYIIHCIFMLLFLYYIRSWIYNIYNINYIIYSYISLYVGAFLGHGSLKYLFSYKMVALIFVLLFVYFATRLSLNKRISS